MRRFPTEHESSATRPGPRAGRHEPPGEADLQQIPDASLDLVERVGVADPHQPTRISAAVDAAIRARDPIVLER